MKKYLLFKRSFKDQSNFTRADHLISQSKKYKINDDHYLKLKKINDLENESLEKVDVYFSLAKAEEDIGNIKKHLKLYYG